MLKRIDKFAPFLALALLGYLGYSANELQTVKPAQGKDPPTVTREMLHPKLVQSEDHASPAGRDPFDVAWASYLPGVEADISATQPSERQPATCSAPAAASATTASAPALPALPTGRISGVILGSDAQFLIVEGKIYKTGQALRGDDPARAWVIEQINSDNVVLSFGQERRTLKMQPMEETTRPARPTGGPSR
jgi:hypothetical protein